MHHTSFLAIARAFSYAAVLILTLGGPSAPQPLVSISGFVLHCDARGSPSVNLGDTVKVTDGKQSYAAQLNSDGSYTLTVQPSAAYNLYVYASGRTAPVWQQRITAGSQNTICIRSAS
jgi:hypothetical protein